MNGDFGLPFSDLMSPIPITKKRLIERLSSIAVSQLEADGDPDQLAIDHKAADDLLLMYIDGDELGEVHDAFDRIRKSY